MWHKIVLISDANKRSSGRPAYSHLVCFRKGAPTAAYRSGRYYIPDVFDRGHMLWPKGIGLHCCLAGISFLYTMETVTTVVDPFCGVGTVLAMANVLHLDAVGVEISSKRCTKARGLNISEAVNGISRGELSMMGCNVKHVKLCSDFTVLGSGDNEVISSNNHDDDDDNNNNDDEDI